MKFDERNDNWGNTKYIEWSKLLSEGYVKDGKIVVICDISINSENVRRRKIDFEQVRPNEMDLTNILEVQHPSKFEQFEEDFVVSEITEKDSFSDLVTVFGLPAKVCVKKCKKDGKDFMSLYFYLNDDDKTEWWRCQVWKECKIVNQADTKKTSSKSSLLAHSASNSNWGWPSFINWSELVDPSNGYIKDGKIKLQVWIQMLEMYGFYENTRRGIDELLIRMTDAVLRIDDNRYLHVCKKILALQSSYFENLFLSMPKNVGFELGGVQFDDLKRFLELVHNVDTDVCEQNVEALLGLIHTYKAPECYERLDLIVKNLEFEDTMKVLELVDKYPLLKLRNKFLLKLKDEELLKSITHSSRYKSLSSDIRVAILEWKLIPEESRTEDVEPSSYQFSTDFDDESDMTDVKINVNDYNYYASKQILSNASHFFMKKFYGPYFKDISKNDSEDNSEDDSEDDSDDTLKDISDDTSEYISEVCVLDVTPSEFEKLLTHIYHPTRPVTSANLDSLLQLAHQFSVPRLMDKCEEYLVISDNISLIDKLEFAGKFDLPYLLESCLKFAKNPEKMKEVKENNKFKHLAPKVHSELVKRESE